METSLPLLNSWDLYMYVGAAICVGVALSFLVYHETKLLGIKDLKEKYDYVNRNEIKYFWYSVIAFIVAGAFYANTFATETIQKEGTLRWFYVRLFITASLSAIAYFIFFSLVKIYYPRQLNKRLAILRNKPRVSPTGNVMRKLSEEEEDAHLEASQIEDEKFFVVDYDVWLDDATGYKRIEKYAAYQNTRECPECGYHTFKIISEEVIEQPTADSKGVVEENFRCEYCGHRERNEIQIASLSENTL
jgi:DNA-directed RNA polymerase subunit RPC12/RpoP